MRILIAGCGGFIGFHLTERLLAEGHEVIGADNFASGNRANVADLSRQAGFRFVEHDICRPLSIDGPLDRIYNLACPASPLDFRRLSLEIMDVCSRGVGHLLDLARASGARLLHTSTSEVYGDPLEHPQRESYAGNVNPIGPRACYDEGKRFAEALLTHYTARHAVPVRIARIFNTYGPRMRADDGRVLPNFIRQALTGEPLTVYGDGSQTRSFCYVSDLVDGLMRLCESDETRPVNLGNSAEVTIAEVAREVIALTDSRSELRFDPRPADDPKVRRPDTSRAEAALGWRAQVPRSVGLPRTIAWFRERAG